MDRRELLAGVSVSFSAVLAGCPLDTSPDEVQRTNLTVEVSNDDERQYVISLGLAPAGHEGLAIELPDGTVETYPELRSIEEIREEDLLRGVSLRPVGDDVQTRILRWDTPQEESIQFENVSLGATLFYSVARPSESLPMQTFGTMTCGPETSFEGMGLWINADGVVATTNDCGRS